MGGRDHTVLDLNRQAQTRLGGENRLTFVPGATHLFEEPGTLHTGAELARDWFTGHLARPARPAEAQLAGRGPTRPRDAPLPRSQPRASAAMHSA